MSNFKKTKAEIRKSVDLEIRAALRKRRKALKQHVKNLKARRRDAVAQVREHCKRSRARVTDRAKEIRASYREQANKEIRALRVAAKSACARRVARAKKRGLSDEQVARREAKEALRDERLMARAREGARKRSDRRLRVVQRGEADDEVRDNIATELHGVWEQMKGSIKTKRGISRTEQFLQWVEENADDVIAMQADAAELGADAMIAAAEAEQAATQKALMHTARLKPDDFKRLGVDPDDMLALGMSPTDPADVLAYLEGQAEYYASADAVPF